MNIEILKKTYFEEYLRILLLRDNSKRRENLLNLDASCYIAGQGIKRKQGPPFAAAILIVHNSKKPTFLVFTMFLIKNVFTSFLRKCIQKNSPVLFRTCISITRTLLSFVSVAVLQRPHLTSIV